MEKTIERLTTNNPQNNIENALNLFFVKDGWTCVRGYGREEHKDISLNDLVREIARENDLEIAQSKDDYALSCEMSDTLFVSDGTIDGETVVALFFTAAWVCAELRAKLMAYEDTGLTPEEIMAAADRRHNCKIDCLLAAHNKLLDEVQGLGGIDKIREVMQTPNDPLTLEELRGMDGEPVWYKSLIEKHGEYFILRVINGIYLAQGGGSNKCAVNAATYGKAWLAYRCRPEEGTL